MDKQFLLPLIFLAVVDTASATTKEEYKLQREHLIQEIQADVRATSRWIGKEFFNRKVMTVMRKVPRHEFVPSSQRPYAYANRPLPIGYGQTISQPYVVALMTDLLEVGGDDVVLELGTGSGYQAAVLSELVKEVYTIEIVRELGQQASVRLVQLGYENVEVRVGDGYYGWTDKAPFDAIIVTAAANHIPPPLIKQLKNGGRMVIPVGGPFSTQNLMLVEKDKTGQIKTRQVLPVRFVPLTGRH